MSAKKTSNNKKLSSSWSNVEVTPEPTPNNEVKFPKRVKKRNKTGKSEKRTQELRQKKIIKYNLEHHNETEKMRTK